MTLFDKEYVESHFEPIDWQMRHERIPNDYGIARPANPGQKPMSTEELEAYYEKIAEMELDGIEPIY